MDPSPTAEATRLTDPLRTSPTAKTPGRLDSRSCGRCGASQHPVMRSFEPGEDWRWCYVDTAIV